MCSFCTIFMIIGMVGEVIMSTVRTRFVIFIMCSLCSACTGFCAPTGNYPYFSDDGVGLDLGSDLSGDFDLSGVDLSDGVNDADQGGEVFCGNGKIDRDRGEDCEHSGVVSDLCSYGQMSCTVCNEECKSAPGLPQWCGDGVLQVDADEACDGEALGSASCQTQGKVGELRCDSMCQVDYSFCQNSVKSISLLWEDTCAVMSDGKVKCWGRNGRGELGLGDSSSRMRATAVPDLSSVKQISMGYQHACALLQSGQVKCWGETREGATGHMESNKKPALVPNLSNVDEIATGAGVSCALIRGGKVKCWGDRYDGKLGDGGSTSGMSIEPVEVQGINNAVHIATKGSHVCALLLGGAIKCWGAGSAGQLGNGSEINQNAPVSVQHVIDADQIVVGSNHTCALVNGGVRCWGENRNGQLGDNTTMKQSLPLSVPGLQGVKSLFSGGLSTCALLEQGKTLCWGYNANGELGNGSKETSLIPVEVTVIDSEIEDIVFGKSHACALLKDKSVRCWGDGFLGDGESSSSLAPKSVLDL